MNTWDQIVMKAWLARSMSDSPRRHPPKADRIYARYHGNIERTERYLTAERMVERYEYSSYTAAERANDHAMSYESNTWQYEYWADVAANILRIQKETER